MVRELGRETGQRHGTIQRVAEQVGCGVESLRTWVKQVEVDAGEVPGVTSAEAERIRVLEQENRELRRANAHLEVGVGFLRGGARPPTAMIVAYIDERQARARRLGSRARVRGRSCRA